VALLEGRHPAIFNNLVGISLKIWENSAEYSNKLIILYSAMLSHFVTLLAQCGENCDEKYLKQNCKNPWN
jgi:hypothetical protein